MTQIDVTRFGKFKALPNYSKVGKQAHMKRLFVGVWNLSGGVSAALKLQSQQRSPALPPCQAALPKFHHLCLLPRAPPELSLKHKQAALLRPPGLFATFISDKSNWEKARLASELHRRGSGLQYFSEVVVFFLSCCSRSCLTRLLRRYLRKHGGESSLGCGEQIGTTTTTAALLKSNSQNPTH